MNKKRLSQAGFTLFEIIIAVFILAVSVVPIMESFGPAFIATRDVERSIVFSNQARGTLNRMLALGFSDFDGQIGITDPSVLFDDTGEDFFWQGEVKSPVIAISDKSGDNPSTLLELSVTIDEISFFSQKADY